MRFIKSDRDFSLRHEAARTTVNRISDGFRLESHVDIPLKLFAMLVYLTNAPELHDAGTDICDASPGTSEQVPAPPTNGTPG